MDKSSRFTRCSRCSGLSGHGKYSGYSECSEDAGCDGCSGAITVEYAIIFPIVILCILLLIYMGMIYYQQSLIQAVVSENVQNYALLWGYSLKSIDIKGGLADKDTYTSEQLYEHIFSNTNEKKEITTQQIKNEFMQKSIIKPTQDMDVQTSYHNYLFYRKVGISAKVAYPLPFKGLLESIGLSGDIVIEAYSEMTINDPKEFIQNVDYLWQIYEEAGTKDWVKGQCEPLVNTLQKIKEYFN